MMNHQLRKVAYAVVWATVGLACSVSFSTANAKRFDIKRNYVKFEGDRYFVRKASSVKLGSFGTKKTPPTQQNYLFRQAEFKNIGRIDTSAPQFASKSSETSLFHSGNFSMPIKLVKLGISDTGYSNMVRNHKCKFVRESISDLNKLMDNLNRDKKLINKLKFSNSSRIVNEVIRVKSCIVQNKNKHAGSLKGDVKVAKQAIKVKGKDQMASQNEVVFAFGKDTVIGYRMLKFKWDKKNKNKRKRIVRLEDDGQSLN